MKKQPSKVAHNRPQFFFQYCQLAQNQSKSQFLFHKNCSPHDLCIMTLIAMCGCTFFIEERKLLKWGSIIVITQQLAQYIVQTRPTFHKPYNIAAKPSLAYKLRHTVTKFLENVHKFWSLRNLHFHVLRHEYIILIAILGLCLVAKNCKSTKEHVCYIHAEETSLFEGTWYNKQTN